MINSWLVQLWFVIHRKKLEEVNFAVEEFLHRKENKKDVYYGLWCVTKDIPEDACSKDSLIQALWRFEI